MRLKLILAIIFLTVNNAGAALLYRISGVTDITVSSWNIGDPGITRSMDLCAYTSLAGSYSVNITSVTGYNLTSGLNTLPYTLKWEDSGVNNLGSNTGTALTNGVTLSNRQNSNHAVTSTDCTTGSPAGKTARLYFNISQAAMIAAKAGTYGGIILITVGP